MMAAAEIPIRLPYIYKNGQFAAEFGGYTLSAHNNYRLPDEYSVAPSIYGYFTRNTTVPLNDALTITSDNSLDIRSYRTATIDFDVTKACSGAIYIRVGDTAICQFDLSSGLADGNHVVTSAISGADAPGRLAIRIQAWDGKADMKISIHTIKLA